MHEVNESYEPQSGNPLGDMMMNEWKTERKMRMEQETNPTKNQKLERLVVDEVDELIFTGSTTMSTHSASVRVIKDREKNVMCMNVIT